MQYNREYFFPVASQILIKEIVAKALDGQRYLLPLCEYMLMCDGERGSGPKGANDLCSVIFEDLGLKVSINNEI